MLVGFKSKRMDKVKFLIIIVIFHVVYSCDPYTQYELNGTCCSKCGPGTRMVSGNSNCNDPQCKPCEVNEYQPNFTTANKCILQPYCDPNKNFDVVTNRNKTSPSPCRCKMGYHCSSEECLTCAEHTKCTPGQYVASRGDHILDTKCKSCPAKTFSSASSVNECKPWTICGSESITESEGTATSDTVCVPASSAGVTIAIVVCVLFFLLLAVMIFFWRWKGTHDDAINKAKESCMDCLRFSCFFAKAGDQEVGNVERPPGDWEPMIQYRDPPSPQHPVPQTPVEDEDSQAVFNPKPQDVTENGHVVAQEEGKADHMSVSDSQMSVVITT